MFAELCAIVDETIALHKKDNKLLSLATCGKDYDNKMLIFAQLLNILRNFLTGLAFRRTQTLYI